MRAVITFFILAILALPAQTAVPAVLASQLDALMEVRRDLMAISPESNPDATLYELNYYMYGACGLAAPEFSDPRPASFAPIADQLLYLGLMRDMARDIAEKSIGKNLPADTPYSEIIRIFEKNCN
ncbi:MAG: hypothetical protein FWD33_04075 [Alphaproteobacteria bacterium]|nr:hypothetical protein [Alphaproteobacteria bacterium]